MNHPNKQDYLQRLKAYTRQSNKELAFFVVIAVFGFMLTWPLGWYAKGISKDMAGPAVISFLMLYFFITVPAMAWLNRRNLRKHGLLCPSCGRQLHRSIIVTTGKCGYCGEQIVELD